MRSHGITKDGRGFNVMTELGYNYRLTEMQAALGITQLKKLDRFLKTRRQIVKWYQAALAKNTNIVLPKEIKGSSSAWHLYVIRTKEIKDRLPLYNFLKDKGVGVNFHYPCVYQHPYYRAHGFKNVICPAADHYAETAITLPLHTLLTRQDVLFIAKIIKDFLK